jgi:hypothetical protein
MKVPSVEVMLQHLQAPPVIVSTPVSIRSTIQGGFGTSKSPVGILLAVNLALGEIDAQVALVLAELGHVFLDRIAHVAQRQHEMVMPVGRVVLHDVPQQRLAPDLDQRLGTDRRLFDQARALAACKNRHFHFRQRTVPAPFVRLVPLACRFGTRLKTRTLQSGEIQAA